VYNEGQVTKSQLFNKTLYQEVSCARLLGDKSTSLACRGEAFSSVSEEVIPS